MNICGEIVTHKIFGKGKIIEFENNQVTIEFEKLDDTKKFSYPAAFGKFLHLENEGKSQLVEANKVEEEERIIEKKRLLVEQTKIELNTRAVKNGVRGTKSASKAAVKKSNIAFKCNYCDGGKDEIGIGYKGICSDETIKHNITVGKHIWCRGEDSLCKKFHEGEITREELLESAKEKDFVCYESNMLESWKAFAGIVQSGVNKGKPMTLRKVTVDSLAMLTTKFPRTEDRERVIFAVFLVDENYQGDNKEEGFVGANSKYRLKLSKEEAEKLKFWNFYFNPNKPEKIVFGSGLHRYFTDIQSAQVLSKLAEIKKGTEDEELAQEFLEHFCRIKGLDFKSLQKPEGALIKEQQKKEEPQEEEAQEEES